MVARRTPTAVLAPMALHCSQIEILDRTAESMKAENPAVRQVSRAWALRELLIWGAHELEERLRARQDLALQAPSPPRGAPRSGEARAAARARTEYTTLPPTPIPREVALSVRQAVRAFSSALRAKVSTAVVVRELIALGWRRRERARIAAVGQLALQRAALAKAGFATEQMPTAVVVGTYVAYMPPGPSAFGWNEGVVELTPRGGAASLPPSMPLEGPRVEGTAKPPRHAPRARRTRRNAPKSSAGDGDDEPIASVANDATARHGDAGEAP